MSYEFRIVSEHDPLYPSGSRYFLEYRRVLLGLVPLWWETEVSNPTCEIAIRLVYGTRSSALEGLETLKNKMMPIRRTVVYRTTEHWLHDVDVFTHLDAPDTSKEK